MKTTPGSLAAQVYYGGESIALEQLHALHDAPDACEITVPMPPTLTNSGAGRSRHWRAVEREKSQYWHLLDNLRLAGQVAAPPPIPYERVTLRSRMVLRGGMDEDNAAARHKWLLDWLRTRGYIVSDRRSHCRWEGFPEQRVSRREPPAITLTITRSA